MHYDLEGKALFWSKSINLNEYCSNISTIYAIYYACYTSYAYKMRLIVPHLTVSYGTNL